MAQENPNFLIILADDCTYTDLSLYGGENAKTPNIDRLAAEGLTFNRAGITMAMCQPARSALYTGQYPMRNGAAWNHCKSYPETRSMPHYLGELGYRVGISGKRHIEPEQAFPFEIVNGFDPNCVRNPTNAHQTSGIEAFMNNKDEPFALVVALVEPHKPWVMGDPSAYPVESIKLPDNLVDNATTRESFAKYLAEITYMDQQVGEILQSLEKSGQADNTIVIFSSEQGAQWPGCKWTNWERGVRTSFVVRWPGVTPVEARTDAMVQWVDVVPTLLDILGEDLGEYPLDGVSFKSVIVNGDEGERSFMYSMHNNLPEGPAYPIRAISNGRFKYIRNLKSDAVFINKYMMGKVPNRITNNLYWQTWVWDSANDAKAEHLVFRFMKRPAEELYDLENDPHEMTNLADNERHQEIRVHLSEHLDAWMLSQRDPGLALDTERALKSSRELKHVFHY